jgi:hypothetical protein
MRKTGRRGQQNHVFIEEKEERKEFFLQFRSCEYAERAGSV